MNKTGIVNAALLLIGARRIDVVSSSGTKQARLANTIYDQCRDEIFDMPYEWSFARARAQLSMLSDDPAFGTYDHQYTRPAGCRRVLATLDVDGDEVEYPWRRELYIETSGTQQIEHDVILYNEDECYVKYIALRTNPAVYPAWFTKLIIINMAFYLHEPLKQNTQIYKKLKDMWAGALNNALAANALEDVDTDDNNVRLDKGNNDLVDAPSLTSVVTNKRIIERT